MSELEKALTAILRPDFGRPTETKRDLIAEMKGPDNNGCAVFMNGRCVPNLAMYDRGDEIEFVLDHRLSVSFPRDHAWNAVAFAFGAMALGAGCDPLNFEPKPFARRVSALLDAPSPSPAPFTKEPDHG